MIEYLPWKWRCFSVKLLSFEGDLITGRTLAKMSNGRALKIKNEYDPDYKIVPASGIFGGLTPRGELRVDFFTEYSPTPPEVQITVSEQGKKIKEIQSQSDCDFIRRTFVTIIVPAQHVESFANWFLQKAKEISTLKGKKVNDVSSTKLQ